MLKPAEVLNSSLAIDRVDRQAGVHGERRRSRAELGDTRKRFDGIVRQFVNRGIHRIGDGNHQQRVPVSDRIGGSFGADQPAGASAVVYDDLLAEALGEMICEITADDIVAASGRKRHDQADGLGWIAVGRLGVGGRCAEANRASGELGKGYVHARAFCTCIRKIKEGTILHGYRACGGLRNDARDKLSDRIDVACTCAGGR